MIDIGIAIIIAAIIIVVAILYIGGNYDHAIDDTTTPAVVTRANPEPTPESKSTATFDRTTDYYTRNFWPLIGAGYGGYNSGYYPPGSLNYTFGDRPAFPWPAWGRYVIYRRYPWRRRW
jgi:hypothetical protein